jgi:hypothetical protein
MGIDIDVKREYIVNGKKYNSLEEMPLEIRKILDETLASSSVADILKAPMHANMKIKFNDKEYDSIESMPVAERAVYELAMKAAGLQGAGQAIPSGNWKEGSVSVDPSHPVSPVSQKPIVPESSLSVRWLFAAAASILGILVGFYFLFSR